MLNFELGNLNVIDMSILSLEFGMLNFELGNLIVIVVPVEFRIMHH